jgi:hypothetical protein
MRLPQAIHYTLGFATFAFSDLQKLPEPLLTHLLSRLVQTFGGLPHPPPTQALSAIVHRLQVCVLERRPVSCEDHGLQRSVFDGLKTMNVSRCLLFPYRRAGQQLIVFCAEHNPHENAPVALPFKQSFLWDNRFTYVSNFFFFLW